MVDERTHRLERKLQEENHTINDSTTATTKLSVHSLSELRSKNVPSTDDSPKYNYKAVHDEGEGNYSFEFCEAKILVIIDARGSFVENVAQGEECSLILDQTCFYAEQGGQIHDQGYITVESQNGMRANFSVQKVILQKGGYILHCGVTIEGSLRVGDTVALNFDVTRRRLNMNNHTSAHILDHALLEILGSEYSVKGSLVTPDRLQLDFSSKKAMTAEQIRKVENMVVEMIERNVPVYTMYCKREDAMKIIGLITLANVEYPDPARVVSIGEPIDALIENPQSEASLRTSVDFCGGTHVHRSGHIGRFVIASEETLSKGFRRIVALSGPGVDKAIREAEALRKETQNLVDLGSERNDTRLLQRKWTEFMQVVSASVIPYNIKDKIRRKLNEFKKIIDDKDKTAKLAQNAKIIQQAENLVRKCGSASFVVELLDADSNKEAVDTALKKVRSIRKNLSTMFLSVDKNCEKIFAMCTVAQEAIEKRLTADEWIKSVTAMMNGKGGGNPKWAQASGSNFTQSTQIIDEARRFAAERLGGEAEDSLTNSTDSNAVASISDVYNTRKLIAEQFSSEAKERSASLSCNGASYYLCDDSFKGGSDSYRRAAVLQWINFADFALWPSIKTNNSRWPKFDTKTDAYQKLVEYLKYLNGVLETNTFLLYHELTLADIAVFTCLLPLLRLDTDLKIVEREYVNVYRWFRTVCQHPCVQSSRCCHITENK